MKLDDKENNQLVLDLSEYQEKFNQSSGKKFAEYICESKKLIKEGRVKRRKKISSYKSYHKDYYERNKEKIATRMVKYRKNNREKINAYMREHKRTHREEYRAYHRKYYYDVVKPKLEIARAHKRLIKLIARLNKVIQRLEEKEYE